jgi:Site-specific DNA methylase
LHADYLSPLQISIDAALEAFGIEEEEEEEEGEALKSIADIESRFKNGQSLVAEFESSEWKNKYGESIDKNPVYIQFRHDFNARIQGEKRKTPLRVLDLFCGIGSGMVVLKKLKIPLCTVVHVEHDPVAVEVCKFRHENDGIRHVYVEAFEDIYGDVDWDEDPDEELLGRYIDEYGPFDLVLAAAPCQYDSHGHASKSKKRIVNANYLWKVGVLIQKMNDIQKSQHGVRHDVCVFISTYNLKSRHEIRWQFSGRSQSILWRSGWMWTCTHPN